MFVLFYLRVASSNPWVPWALWERICALQSLPLYRRFGRKKYKRKIKLKCDHITTGKNRPTKREMMSLVMSVYDPLGFISRFTVKGKTLLQAVWRSGIGCDDELPHSLLKEWQGWTQEFPFSTRDPTPYPGWRKWASIWCSWVLAVPVFRGSHNGLRNGKNTCRSFTSNVISSAGITSGGDGRSPGGNDQNKSPVANQGDPLLVWLDYSMIDWLKKDARSFNSFVANRVGEIQDTTSGDSWHWVPTDLNVADEATRDTKECNFLPEARWFQGPDFLKLSPEFWPKRISGRSTKSKLTWMKKFFWYT